MVTFAEFTEKSLEVMTEQEFEKIEPRVVDLLSALCGSKWDNENETCKKAVIYQIEYIIANGGASSWVKGRLGKVASHSYSIGGESESIGYDTSEKSESGFVYQNLLISPLVIATLKNAGFYRDIEGVRVC